MKHVKKLLVANKTRLEEEIQSTTEYVESLQEQVKNSNARLKELKDAIFDVNLHLEDMGE